MKKSWNPLDEGSLDDDYKIKLRELENILKSEKYCTLSRNTRKGELSFLGQNTKKQYNTIIGLKKISKTIKSKGELVYLGSPKATFVEKNCQRK